MHAFLTSSAIALRTAGSELSTSFKSLECRGISSLRKPRVERYHHMASYMIGMSLNASAASASCAACTRDIVPEVYGGCPQETAAGTLTPPTRKSNEVAQLTRSEPTRGNARSHTRHAVTPTHSPLHSPAPAFLSFLPIASGRRSRMRMLPCVSLQPI